MTLERCTALNPATLLPVSDDGEKHDCQEEATATAKSRYDLKDHPLGEGEVLFVNSSSRKDQQSAGLVERMNGTIKNRLKKCMEETGKPWTQCVDLVKTYINITSASGLTPYETLFGRPYRLPQFKNDWEPADETDRADYMRKMFEKQKKAETKHSIVVSQQDIPLVGPGGWVLIRSVKRKHWHSPKCS